MTSRPTRREAVLTTAAAALSPTPAAAASLVLNDASRLNPTPVFKHWRPARAEGEAFLGQLRAELRAASAAGRPIGVGGARHSMGGQSLPRDGTAISLDMVHCEPDSARGVYRINAGARWRQVQAALGPIGFSPKVQQANNDFSVAGTFSVNAHSWPVPFGPMGSTVRSLRMMLVDGEIVTCSRVQEADLFRLAMGGYGLFGVILDCEVEMAPNLLLQPHFEVMPSTAFAKSFVTAVNDPRVALAYGRLNVTRAHFLEESILASFLQTGKTAPLAVTAPEPSFMGAVTRRLYRAQTGSEAMKQARWYAETVIGPQLQTKAVSRNALLGQPVSALANSDMSRTDILHEYFLPPARLSDFLAACRGIIPPFGQELLNVTLRYLAGDHESVLVYAPGPRIAAVMSFAQRMTPEAEVSMRHMTEALVDRALALGGSYYLPYRLHARPEQLSRAYPALGAFCAAKRRYDPGLVFRNAFWDRYLAHL